MDIQQVRQLTADLLNEKITIQDIPRGRIYLLIQKTLVRMDNLPLVKAMGILAGQRLAAEGYQKCMPIGWVKSSNILNIGIGLVYGKWVVTNPEKFCRYKL